MRYYVGFLQIGSQISIAINEINGNGGVYYAINKATDLIIHCWNLNVLML